MKSISILGSGWLGKPLGSHLVRKGYEVSGSTTTKEKLIELKKEGIIPYHFSFAPYLESEDPVSGFFDTDVLIISIPPRRKAGLGEEYVQQISEILKSARESLTKNIILISSTSVYPDLNLEVTENDSTDSIENLMAKAENLLIKSGISHTVIRFAGLVGPGRHPGKFFAGKKEVSGAESPVNLIHLEDCISIIEQIIDKEVWGEIFNACSDNHPSKKDFYTLATEKLGLQAPEFSKEPQLFKIVNSNKIKEALNYNFKFSDPYEMI